ncbi:MAG: type IV pilus modification protein PilV [Pseudomonadota bacterium]
MSFIVKKRNAGLSRQRGVAMMEVLVTIVVIAIGALGLASLQLTSMKFNKESAVRSKATLLTIELSDRMRSNMVGVKAGSYSRNYGYTAALTSTVTAPGCGSGSECTSAQMATLDLADWLKDIANDLPSGTGAIVPATNNFNSYNIVVMWKEKSLVDANATDSTCPSPAVAGVRCLSTSFTP